MLHVLQQCLRNALNHPRKHLKPPVLPLSPESTIMRHSTLRPRVPQFQPLEIRMRCAIGPTLLATLFALPSFSSGDSDGDTSSRLLKPYTRSHYPSQNSQLHHGRWDLLAVSQALLLRRAVQALLRDCQTLEERVGACCGRV